MESLANGERMDRENAYHSTTLKSTHAIYTHIRYMSGGNKFAHIWIDLAIKMYAISFFIEHRF